MCHCVFHCVLHDDGGSDVVRYSRLRLAPAVQGAGQAGGRHGGENSLVPRRRLVSPSGAEYHITRHFTGK